MRNSALFLASTASVLYFTTAAIADELSRDITIEQASKMLHYSGGNDRMRVEVAPNYSEELGFSLKGVAGGYLTDELALGLIVEYGENKREYLANAGIQFSDELSFVGTVGMLEEHHEYVDGDGRKMVQQMEYGGSLKGAYDVGILSGFELNGYLTNADAGSDTVETGDLYGVQLLADIDLTDTTHLKLGGGYEWLEWADGNNNDSFAFSAEGVQRLGDMFSINANASVGASQNVYGGGFELDLSRDGLNTNMLGLSYNYIDGKDGIQDDQRVELSWTYGFGSGPTQVASAETHDVSTIRPAADVAMVSPANNLLNDVTKRPEFLPQTVIARAKAADVTSCSSLGIEAADGKFVYIVYGSTPYVDMVLLSPEYDLSTETVTVTLGTTELTYISGATPPGYRFYKEAETVYTDGETQTLTVEVDGKTCTDTVTAEVVDN